MDSNKCYTTVVLTAWGNRFGIKMKWAKQSNLYQYTLNYQQQSEANF